MKIHDITFIIDELNRYILEINYFDRVYDFNRRASGRLQ